MATPHPSTKTDPVQARLAAYVERTDARLADMLPSEEESPRKLHAAMRYAVLGGGKRLRPLLSFAAAEALQLSAESVEPIACALELIHAYSLVHDDLPAMDDDDIRRGRPTLHRAYDEATAILAGDALQALAFEIVARIESPAGACIVAEMARACGSRGMAGGQAIDLGAVGSPLGLDELKHMHALKTGALIEAAVTLPCLLAGREANCLAEYGQAVGLAFQIKDDVLDIEGSTEEIGKTQGSDIARGKPTFPALLGLEESKALAQRLHAQARDALKEFPGDTTLLAWLADFTVSRSS